MTILATIIGLLLIGVVFWDTFETIVLPRSVTRQFRLTKLFYQSLRPIWFALARSVRSDRRRDTLLSYFGPLSLILLLALWAIFLMFGFALVLWGLGVPLLSADSGQGLGAYVYMSGVTLFTLGFGDVTPRNASGRTVAVIEAGVGIGFLAMVIGYLPVIYQAFSRREVGISLLDSRAGSPPTAGELLLRHARSGCLSSLPDLLKEWERWAADILESHLSYPVLCFYRSQHDRESWLAALTAIIDACAILPFCDAVDPAENGWCVQTRWQAQLTFAMARHTLIDLALIMNTPPSSRLPNRLPPPLWQTLVRNLREAGIRVDPESEAAVASVRMQYEPYIEGLANRLMLALPPWSTDAGTADNWETSAWDNSHHF